MKRISSISYYGLTVILLLGGMMPGAGTLVISEFVANNESLEDGDGNTPDWIEVHNDAATAVDLSGYHLSDNETLLQKWTFPEGTILGAQEYLVVFASGQVGDSAGNLHANFSLTAGGEYLGLIEPDGITVVQEFSPTYPPQKTGMSYSPEGFYETPTPGVANTGEVFEGFIADTSFSIDRGFYTEVFDLEITTLTSEAEIFYTTDGTVPSATNGTLYVQAIPITTTTVIRAIAVKENFIPTNVDTQTYLFLEDVVTQPNDPPNTTTTWAGFPADYEMDPQVTTSRNYSSLMIPALEAVPSLSIVMDPDDFYGSQGIYQNPQSQGSAWERPISAELISADGSELGFQVDAGIRIQGGSSRDPDTPKHSLSLRFREEYGEGKLDYPLFQDAPYGESAVEKFDFLQLRSGYNHGFVHRHYYQSRHAQYNRDQFANDLMFAMGSESTHGRWVNLYINGVYWGIYHIHERPDDNYMASYFGGDNDDYDAINSNLATSGTRAAYDAMEAIAAGSQITTPSVYEAMKSELDIDQMIDYMIMNFYVGNVDWDFHNWRAAGQGAPGVPFHVFAWDSEFAISPNTAGATNNPFPLENALTVNVSTKNNNNGPTGIHQDLRRNSEYLMRFADRIQAAMFNGGPLSPEGAEEIWRTRSDVMDTLIVAESARWGDYRRDVDSPRWPSTEFDLYTRNEHYFPNQEWIMNTYLVERPVVVLNQFRAQGLYPSVDPPLFSQSLANLTLTNPNDGGTIYFTADGSDPREPTASIYSGRIIVSSSAIYRARVLEGGVWSALQTFEVAVGVPADASNLVISEIYYNPPGVEESGEFIELMNVSSVPLDLSNVSFADGVGYTFPVGTTLAPGSRVVLNPGLFQGALANGGESIILNDASGLVIESFSYGDGFPWPASADGDGYSLVRISPESQLDPTLPSSWRSSVAIGGNPGTTDASVFAGNEDDLLSYALGETPISLGSMMGSATIHRNVGADDVVYLVEHSDDLVNWTVTVNLVSQERSSEGIISDTYLVESGATQFFRVRVVLGDE